MAQIELKNIYKQFKSTRKASLVEVFNPFAAYALVSKRMQEDMAINPKKYSFAIENLNLTIPNGKVMVILGPSGCGKTTLLRLIGGLERADAGEILYDGVSMEDVPPDQRKIGMIFQNYALYPHFTSKKNILSYFLFKKKTPELDKLAQEKYKKTSELLGVDIEYFLNRSPARLSGGEKQRVALGRCITRDPRLFLLDEPFSNLDQKLREKYRLQLKRLLHHFNITTVYVTHDQQEALILGDLLAVMDIGAIAQVGTPQYIYDQPYNLFVADFLSLDVDTPAINIFDGKDISVKFQEFIVGVRSEDLLPCKEKSGAIIKGTIVDIRHIPIKHSTVLCVNTGKTEIYARLPLTEDFSRNTMIILCFKKYHLFDKKTGRRTGSYPQ